MEPSPIPAAFLALVTVKTSLLLRATYDATIAQKLLSLPSSGLLVTCSLTSATSAMCWLTSPVPVGAVESVQQSGLLGLASTGAVTGGWLAVVSRASNTCINVNSSGVGWALKLLKESVSPICAVCRFGDATDAYKWLASTSVEGLLGVLGDAAGSVITRAAAPTPVAPRTRSTQPLQSRTLLAQASSAATARCFSGTSRPPSGLHMATARSPFSVWSLVALHSVGDGSSVESGHTAGEGSIERPPSAAGPPCRPLSLKRGFSVLKTPSLMARPTGGGSEDQCAANVVFGSLPGVSSSLTKTPLPSFFACSCGAASAAARWMGPRLDGALARAGCEPSTSPSAQRRCSCSSGGKRARLLKQGGVGAALNPSSIGAPDGCSVFSRANIARSVAESARVWEQTDRDAALDAILNADAATQQAHLPSLSSGSTVPPQTCTVLAVSLSTLAAGDSVTSAGNDGLAPASPSAPSAGGGWALAPAGGLPGSIDHHALTSALAAAGDEACSMGAGAATCGRGSLRELAAAGQWKGLYERLAVLGQGVSVTGGPGVGKSTFWRGLHQTLLTKWPHAGEVIIITPTGSAAKTANGQTYHSFFGYPRDYRMQHTDPVA